MFVVYTSGGSEEFSNLPDAYERWMERRLAMENPGLYYSDENGRIDIREMEI